MPLKQTKISKSKVFVGLSGGVDSSVSAALLQSQGYEVHGVFIKVWQPDFYECSWKQDRLDAMRVCAKLQIPFTTLDLEKEYKKEVVDYMISEYKIGRTPNPDVMCNKFVKFGGFFDWAMKKGADFVATGHYAQIKFDKKTGEYHLVAGDDKNKDQSYFLWTLTQKQLSKTLFPVGNIEKPIVRKLAKKFNLPTATKKDSQGLCFIGKVDLKEFLKHFVKTKKGKVLNIEGEVVGEHDGAIFYTIGQRHGFTLSANSNNDERHFVIKKDIRKNTITVSADQSCLLGTLQVDHIVKLEKVSFTTVKNLQANRVYQARIRYRQPLSNCQIQNLNTNTCEVIFKTPQKARASGQSLVFYDGEVCLGGGIIL